MQLWLKVEYALPGWQRTGAALPLAMT